MTRSLVSCCFFLLARFCCASPTDPVLELKWGNSGLSSLRYCDRQYLARGEFLVNAVSFNSASGLVTQGSVHGSISEDAAANAETIAFDWGAIHVHYKVQAGRLIAAIEISNKTKLTLSSLSLDALALQLPSPPRQYDGKQPMLGTNIGAPTLLPLDFAGGSVVLTDDDVNRPLLLGIPWSLNPTGRTIFPIRINTGRDAMYPDSLPLIERPIPPGAKDDFQISLRFSRGPSDIRTSAADVLRKFARSNEFTLRWPDRRPIGSLIIATAATKWTGNPSGWLLDPKIDVTNPAGIATFHSRLLAWADHSISILKKMNAQGMITWDIEGERYPHPETYVGDPTLCETLAPEMAGVVDDYFKRFRDAGLRVGVTIRPQRFEQTGANAKQIEVPDPAAELTRKIAFAKKRWGATLFYVDSNGDPAFPLSSAIIAKVARTFPDILLIPEHKNTAYYAKSAPYSECRGGSYSTPDLAAAIYPGAFSVINTADGLVDKHYNDLLAGVNRGDILMFRGWFDDPANTTIRAIYSRSKFKAP